MSYGFITYPKGLEACPMHPLKAVFKKYRVPISELSIRLGISPNLIRSWLDAKWPMPAKVEDLLWAIAHKKKEGWEDRGRRGARPGVH
jgi:hypothetical protein